MSLKERREEGREEKRKGREGERAAKHLEVSMAWWLEI
jgi:hypothetical protein